MRVFAIKRNGKLTTKNGKIAKNPRFYSMRNHATTALTYWAQGARSQDIERCSNDLIEKDTRTRDNYGRLWWEHRQFCDECFPPLEEYKTEFTVVAYDLVEVDE